MTETKLLRPHDILDQDELALEIEKLEDVISEVQKNIDDVARASVLRHEHYMRAVDRYGASSFSTVDSMVIHLNETLKAMKALHYDNERNARAGL